MIFMLAALERIVEDGRLHNRQIEVVEMG